MGLISTGQLFQYAEQMTLNAVFLMAQSPPPAPTYMALSTAAASGVLSSAETSMGGPTINECPISSGYARQNYGPIPATAASPSQIYNTALIAWGPFTAPPGTCSWAIACDVISGTAAHPLAAFLLSAQRTPAIGDSLQAAAGTGVPGVGFLCQV
jgi:hypothetical protein